MVTLTLDKPRTLRFDFGSFRAIEERTGVSIIREGFNDSDLESIPFFVTALWAAARHEDKALTIEQVEAALTLKSYRTAKEALVAALYESAGKEAPSENPTTAQS